MSSDGEVPEGRCGFVVEPGDVPDHGKSALVNHEPPREVRSYKAGADEWYVDSQAVCCWREVWDSGDGDRCIWHAEIDDKPADALIEARADEPERLDGAYMPAVDLGNAIDFEACRVWAATFDGADLQGASFAEIDGRFAQFPDADLRHAEFQDAYLGEAQFPDIDLRGAQFPDADLWHTEFPDANLRKARFPDADLWYAEFPGAFLRGAQFPDADLSDAQFPRSDLSQAHLSNIDAGNATFSGSVLSGATLTGADLSDADLRDARLHDAHFLDVRINDGTTFGSVAPEEADAGGSTAPSTRSALACDGG